VIELKNLYKSYRGKSVLMNISLTIQDNEFFVLIGSSGCGKTTLLKTLNKLNPIDKGEILINGTPINRIKVTQLPRLMGYVVQEGGLFPHMTVEDNIALAMRVAGYPKEKIYDRITELLELVNLEPDQYRSQYPSQLSGGQRQRIGVARAFAADPEIILMDEPFSALDPMTRRTLQQEVRALQQKLNKTFVFVTHDMEEALDLADLIIFMNHGKIEQMASPEEMLSHPATGLIHDFLGKHMPEQSAADLKVKEFMRTGVYTVEQTRGINECISKMQRHNVDTLIVVDSLKKYLGTVSITDIRLTGHVVDSIGPLIRCNMPTVQTEDNARACFDQLIESGSSYLVVLNPDQTVAGIVTKTSMASAMAEQLWG